MRRKVLFLLIIMLSVSIYANPWGSLKKIYLYKSLNNEKKMLKYLEQIKGKNINKIDADKLGKRLIEIGDNFYLKHKPETAIKFYKKALEISDDFWFVYNKINYIEHKDSIFSLNPVNVFKQFLLLFKDFDSGFLFLNSILKSIFYTFFFVFFVYSLYLFVVKFRLIGNDLIDDEKVLNTKKFFIVVFLVLWPIVILSGWSIYPYLIGAVLYSYLNSNEKRSITFFLISSVLTTIIFSFNMFIENNYKTNEFLTIKKVVDGKLFDSDIYNKFDNELKLYQAYAFYQAKNFSKAFDIVQSVDKKYESKIKYDLLATLYYELEEYQKSIENFEKSLKINENDKITLNNFTIVLLKEESSDLIKQYEIRFPQIRRLKNRALEFKSFSLKKTVLWKRLLSDLKESFNIMNLLKGVGINAVRLPYLYLILLFFVYQFIINRFLYELGESTYCSKCSKIIKKHKIHRSYDLCDECYQLFLIKDVVFLEAKLLKEEELKKKHKIKFLIHMFISLLFPGFIFNYQKKNFSFVLSNLTFWFFSFGALFLSVVFKVIFGYSPLIVNVFMVLSFVIYLISNLIALKGDDYGI